MKKIWNRLLCVALSAMMFTNTTVVCYAQEPVKQEEITLGGGDFDPKEAQKALEKISEAIKGLGLDDKAGKNSGIFNFLKGAVSLGGDITKFMGIVNCTVSFLKLVGIMEDGTAKSLANIQFGIEQIQDTLKEMNQKLDSVISKLNELDVRGQEKDRADKASSMLKNWRDFETNYIEDMERAMDKVQEDMVRENKLWYESHRVSSLNETVEMNPESDLDITKENESESLDDKVQEEEPEQNLESNENPEIIKVESEPKAATDEVFNVHFNASGEMILSSIENPSGNVSDDGTPIAKTVSVPLSNFANLPEWNPNNHVTNVKNVFKKFANTSLGYNEEKSQEFADQAYETLQYRLQCQYLNGNSEISTLVKNSITNYLKHVGEKENGLNAQIQSILNVYSFEKEAKDELTKVIDQFTVRTGLYGVFAMDVLKKCKILSDDEIAPITNGWTTAVNYFDSVKQNVLTGNDNYCYITNSLVTADRMSLSSIYDTISEHWHISFFSTINYKCNYSYTAKPWMPELLLYPEKNESYTLMNSVQTRMLYDSYVGMNDDSSFKDYLVNNKTVKAENADKVWTKRLLTRWNAENFSLGDKIPMFCHYIHGDYFSAGKTYEIWNSGNKGSAGQVKLHDKVSGDYLDLVTYKDEVNKVIGARANYRESSSAWYIDECHYFVTNPDYNWWGRSGAGKHNGHDLTKDSYVEQYWNTVLLLVPIQDKIIVTDGQSMGQAIDPLAYYYEDAGFLDKLPEPKCTEKQPCESKVTIKSSEDIKEDAWVSYVREQAEKAKVNLTDSEVQKIVKDIHTQIEKEEKIAKLNKNLLVADPFGIKANSSKMSQLIDEVFTGRHSLEDGIDQFGFEIIIEPRVTVEFKNKKPIIQEAYDVEVDLLANDYEMVKEANDKISWNTVQSSGPITEEIIEKLGLSLTLRIPTVNAQNSKQVNVEHYDARCSMSLLESKKNQKIQGSGNNRYVEMTTKHAGIFALNYPNSSNKSNSGAKTGLDTNVSLWTTSLFVSVGLLVILLRKKYN